MKKYVITGTLVLGLGAAFSHHGLHGFSLLAWPLGALAGAVAWSSLSPAARSAFRIEKFRPQAVLLRQTDPKLYLLILEQPGGREAAAQGLAEEYVSAFLRIADENATRQRGNTNDAQLQKARERAHSELRTSA